MAKKVAGEFMIFKLGRTVGRTRITIASRCDLCIGYYLRTFHAPIPTFSRHWSMRFQQIEEPQYCNLRVRISEPLCFGSERHSGGREQANGAPTMR